jgi:hypothetical protein
MTTDPQFVSLCRRVFFLEYMLHEIKGLAGATAAGRVAIMFKEPAWKDVKNRIEKGEFDEKRPWEK